MKWLIFTHVLAFAGGAIVYAFYARKVKMWTLGEIENLKRKF